MLIYIIKSSACLAVFMLFYKFFLEKETLHSFKRFYLLGILLVSIVIPFITFTEYIEVSSQIILQDVLEPSQLTEITPEEQTNYIALILWSIYGFGVFVFLLKFILNLSNLFDKIKRNPKQKTGLFTNVLLNDLIIPHTFFNFIFLNKQKFETRQIPKEVILHEQTHAKQKHALDILCVEVLQIIFWFNPLLYFIKKDIKLNHEFLADQAVLNHGFQPSKYQTLLLEYSSYSNSNQLANAINYSSIKKRFTVMKTKTSKTTMWLRSLVLLPLLALLIYSFSSTKTVEKDIFSKTSVTNHTARSISIKVFSNGTYYVDDIKATKKTFVSVINQLHQDITPEIRNKIINIHVSSETDISDKEVWFIYNSVIDYGFHRIVTNSQEIIREKGNKPFAITNSRTQEDLKAINKKAELQKGASKKQLAEYNKLAKKHNAQPQNKRIIKRTDIERLDYLYSLMSKEQKAKAEPFPNIPPPPPAPPKAEVKNIPPPPPPAPKGAKTGSTTINGKTHYYISHQGKTKYYNKWGTQVDKKGNEVLPPPPPIPANATPEQKEKYKKSIAEYKAWHNTKVKKGEVSDIPPPPPPMSPLDYVIHMAKKGATFYLEGKSISSDKAIEVLKKNKSLNIETKNSDSKHAKVFITKKPIVIEKK